MARTDDPNQAVESGIQQLLEIMAQLRDPDNGCPWDREQTFASIAPYTIEEAYEVADAIALGNRQELKGELGDLLFQVVFYAQLGQEEGSFDFRDILAAINDKMLRRHPHVFGDSEITSAEQQRHAWESHKAEERAQQPGDRPPSYLDGIARALPALSRAEKLQRRVARVGFDWPEVDGVLAKIEEEIGEVRAELRATAGPQRIDAEIGDLLFACVNLARHLKVDAEAALRGANDRFERRFRFVEQGIRESGKDLVEASLAEMDRWWDRAKAEEGKDRQS